MKKLVAIAAALKAWLKPGPRRLAVAVGAVAAVIFGPLLIDLFFVIPWSWRWAMGEVAFIALIAAGLVRLMTVKPGDRWWLPIGSEPPGPADRWVPWLLRFAAAALAVPLLARAGYASLGFADWDYYLEKYEVVRQTILHWRQFPWWDPWTRGGFPLAACPQIGVISPATALVLPLGRVIGLGVTTVLYLEIAVEGAYRLGWLFLREPWAAAAVALIYGLNGAVILDTSYGFYIPMSYGVLPWMTYHAARIGDRYVDGVALGFWAAFHVLTGLHYLGVYAVLIAGAVWLRAMRVQPRGRRATLLAHTASAIGVVLLLAGWRLATAWMVQRDDLREHTASWDESFTAVVHDLLDRPSPDWAESIPSTAPFAFSETTCYIGLLVLCLGLLSLVYGWRWWHTLAAVCGWLAVGSARWYHASFWLSYWPWISSLHEVTRWRFPALLGVGLAVGGLLARWRSSADLRLRWLGLALVLMIATDFVALGFQLLPRTFGIPLDETVFRGPPVATIANVEEGLGSALILRRYGVIRGHEPMLGYMRNAPTARLWLGHPDYVGEAWTASGPVEPASWSPNRLVFQVEPAALVHINQNPGSYWRVNGDDVFPDGRCADRTKPFAVQADAQGRLELEIRPRGLELGLALHVLGAVIFLAAWGWLRLAPSLGTP